MTRFTAFVAPALMLVYGLCRFGDGLDGDRGNGWAWDVGHVAFWLAIVLFVVLGEGLRRRAPSLLTNSALAAVVFGAACFLWVITGDLFESFSDSLPLPGLLNVVGPLLFQLGLLTLLIRQVVARRLPWWSPVLVLVGFATIPVNLDLLPLSAIVVGAGLAPLAVPRSAVVAAQRRRVSGHAGRRAGASGWTRQRP